MKSLLRHGPGIVAALLLTAQHLSAQSDTAGTASLLLFQDIPMRQLHFAGATFATSLKRSLLTGCVPCSGLYECQICPKTREDSLFYSTPPRHFATLDGMTVLALQAIQREGRNVVEYMLLLHLKDVGQILSIQDDTARNYVVLVYGSVWRASDSIVSFWGVIPRRAREAVKERPTTSTSQLRRRQRRRKSIELSPPEFSVTTPAEASIFSEWSGTAELTHLRAQRAARERLMETEPARILDSTFRDRYPTRSERFRSRSFSSTADTDCSAVWVTDTTPTLRDVRALLATVPGTFPITDRKLTWAIPEGYRLLHGWVNAEAWTRLFGPAAPMVRFPRTSSEAHQGK